jgi:hypothetical protein
MYVCIGMTDKLAIFIFRLHGQSENPSSPGIVFLQISKIYPHKTNSGKISNIVAWKMQLLERLQCHIAGTGC